METKMKKTIKISLIVAAVPILFVLVWCVIFALKPFTRPVNLDFAEKITLNYEYS